MRVPLTDTLRLLWAAQAAALMRLPALQLGQKQPRVLQMHALAGSGLLAEEQQAVVIAAADSAPAVLAAAVLAEAEGKAVPAPALALVQRRTTRLPWSRRRS